MISINKDYSLWQLRELIHNNFLKNSHMGEKGFDDEQKQIAKADTGKISGSIASVNIIGDSKQCVCTKK